MYDKYAFRIPLFKLERKYINIITLPQIIY